MASCSIVRNTASDEAAPAPQEQAEEALEEEKEEEEAPEEGFEIPEYEGEPYVEVNGNEPGFDEDDISLETYEVLSEFDELGRAGAAIASVGKESMPTEERGSVGLYRPSGWQLEKYDFIDNGGYLYNRCHLLAWQLTGINDDENNLITGTRYMNVYGMLPFENEVASYIRRTGNHVVYRSTPVYEGDEELARGVLLEASSVEDDGEGVSFNVFCFNVQPGVIIDYETGESRLDEGFDTESFYGELGGNAEEDGAVKEREKESSSGKKKKGKAPAEKRVEGVYILNTNTMRFHYTDCKSVGDMAEHNKKKFKGTRDEAIKKGFKPCGNCKP